ncbi:MAG: AEC family transporter [Blautia faecis]
MRDYRRISGGLYSRCKKKGLLLACAAAVLVHVLFLILTTILKQVLQLDTIERATVIYSNAGILVIPLVQELLGQEYVIYSSAYIAVQLILIWTHCKNMLCEEDRLEWKKSISERKYYFNHSRSDIVCLQNPVAFRHAGCPGYDEQYDWSDRYAACRNGYCGCTS